MTPKIVFSGTAINVTISVILNACTVSFSVSAAQALPPPCSNVRQKIIDSGPIRTISR